jgi:hypothetical protein
MPQNTPVMRGYRSRNENVGLRKKQGDTHPERPAG